MVRVLKKSCFESKVIQGLEGYNYEEVCNIVRDFVEERLNEDGVESISIESVALHGSRLRNTARAESDLDAVVQYSGDIREDDLFNLLNEDPLFIEDIRVDINPIVEDIKSYMNRSNSYDRRLLSSITSSIK